MTSNYERAMEFLDPGLYGASLEDIDAGNARAVLALADNVAELTALLRERLPEPPLDLRCFNCDHIVYEHHDNGCTYMLGGVAYGERRCRCQTPRAIHEANTEGNPA